MRRWVSDLVALGYVKLQRCLPDAEELKIQCSRDFLGDVCWRSEPFRKVIPLIDAGYDEISAYAVPEVEKMVRGSTIRAHDGMK